MDKKFTNILISFVVLLALFGVVMFVLGAQEPAEGALFNFSVDQSSVVSRFVFVLIGVAIAFVVYFMTKENAAWEVGTRQVVWMAIGAALYAVFSWLFNVSVTIVSTKNPSTSNPTATAGILQSFKICFDSAHVAFSAMEHR